MTGGSPLPEVGPWAREKLERLRKYLSAYTTILSKQEWAAGYVYVDAFAGAGKSVLRRTGGPEERELLDGSPRVALDIAYPFTRYVFVERDAARVESLQALQAEFGSTRQIRIEHADCNTYLRGLAASPRVDWKWWRAVVFLDPFGMQVPWATLAGLAQTRAVEVFLNLPVGMAIQRLLRRRYHLLAPARRRQLDDYFGDAGRFDAVYPRRDTLFGPEPRKVAGAADRLVAWYGERLRSAFGHVSPPHLVRNTRRGHLYYLIWAGPNKTGMKIASYVLGSGEGPRKAAGEPL